MYEKHFFSAAQNAVTNYCSNTVTSDSLNKKKKKSLTKFVGQKCHIHIGVVKIVFITTCCRLRLGPLKERTAGGDIYTYTHLNIFIQVTDTDYYISQEWTCISGVGIFQKVLSFTILLSLNF